MEVYFKELNVAELLEHDAFKVWDVLNVGTEFELKKIKDCDGNEKVFVVLRDTITKILSQSNYTLTATSESEDQKNIHVQGETIMEKFSSNKEIKNDSNNNILIGVLPKDESKEIKQFADAGWDLSKLFVCYICRKDEGELSYNHKLHVLIKINGGENWVINPKTNG